MEKKSRKLNLYEKIQAVSLEIMNIEKDMTIGKGNYAYKAVSDNNVILSVKKAEKKYKLMSIPLMQELISSEILKTIGKNGEENIKFVDNIKMTLRIVDLEDRTEYLDVESFGKGVDTLDKGFGKASTYARKLALLNAYKIATGEDPDADKSEELSVPKTLNEKLVKIKNYFNDKLELKDKLLDHFNVSTLDDLKDKDINVIYKTYTEKNLF